MTAAREQVAALLAPESIAIVGASERPGSWAQQVWSNLERFEYPGSVYPVNPNRRVVWSRPCFPDIGTLPEPPDHVVVMVPAPAAVEAVRSAAAAGARSATVYGSGFGEDGSEEGAALRRGLSEAVAETGIALSGPNCMGNLSVPSRLVTITDSRLGKLRAGPIAVVGQSGGIVTAINRSLADRGLHTSHLVTSGNEIGLTTADYIEYFAADPAVGVILCFVESVRSVERFLAACAAAKGARKPVVVCKLGIGDGARAAAQSHTGALAGAVEVFDAVTQGVGVIRVATLDEMLELADYFTHARTPEGAGLAAITFSGGLKGLVLEAASRRGVWLADLAPATLEALRSFLGTGTSAGNPLDSGYTGLSDSRSYLRCAEILLADPNVDLLLAQEELMRVPGSVQKEENLRRLEALEATSGQKPIAMFSMLPHSVTDYGRQLRCDFPHLPFLQGADVAVATAGHVMGYANALASPSPYIRPATHPDDLDGDVLAEVRRLETVPGDGLVTLDEVRAKGLLAAYGVPVLREVVAERVEEALTAAESVGYPVVLKAVSSDLSHKTEAGLVLLEVGTPDEVRSGYETLIRRWKETWSASRLSGILVAPHIRGGIELTLGLHRDREMGLVVMVGAGGSEVELVRDVAFGPPWLQRADAWTVLRRTRVHRLLQGYRARGPFDEERVIDVMVGLGRLAIDLGGCLESIDVNPFLALPAGQGGLALDAFAVFRPAAMWPEELRSGSADRLPKSERR